MVELAEHDESIVGPTINTPDDDWTVIVFGAEFRVSDDELRSLAVPEAAPIFDADGDLVGLCTIGPDGVEMLPVETLPDVKPSTAAPPEQPAAATTEASEATDQTASTRPERPSPGSTAPPATTAAATPATDPPLTTAADSTDVVEPAATSE